MSHDDLLRCERLEARYGASQVLFGIDFNVRRGEVVALLGRNGMGKSTAIKSILGLLRTIDGQIYFDGQRVDTLSMDVIARLGIAIVPEGRQCFPNLTVHEHLIAFARHSAGAEKGRRSVWSPDRLYALFPRLAERKKNLGGQLSGGEQQMLAIGRALSTHPKLLILDEATEGLAPLIREQIWDCLHLLRKEGQTTLVVDKYVDRLLTVADRHLILERGRIVWQGNSTELSADRDLWTRYLAL
ncbi:ABC transporter ATP-binding protein [Pigmentiphaga kullae]|uniref:Branched-chain amino acid transport system ATP-binding protein n=1 Tax=Pigmentiphaga kullae TaxID=151784 RepID=A0A4Q7NN01_9BURK|nr:ABC transporter ATP-binding protein [Pigmentiphaga kullae]RZS86594.1 branched-chain amino acid transport system ATP-binding protein [Pigmentiphaga kullae]